MTRAGTTGRDRPRVVIIGAGFGGLYAAKALARAPVDVIVVDRTNHHVFQPLLYQVATASLSPGDIAAPIRWILRRQRNATVLLAEVRSLDVTRRVARLDGGDELAYDCLILAAGSRHAYFGHDEWERIAPGLKTIEDAAEMRRRFLLAFERAERTEHEAERSALLTFIVVGGGPTGVELAGQLPAIARRALRRDFRRIDTARTRVILVEAGSRLLSTYPQNLSQHAARDLADLDVELRLNCPVTDLTERGARCGGEWIEARTVFWAAGNVASPLARDLGVELDRAGRVRVGPDLSVAGHPEVFVVGDMARIEQDDRLVPGVCPSAIQEGETAARNITSALRGARRQSFRYRNKGDLATIGRHRAVADFGWLRVAGWPAWWLWLFVHIFYLIGFRNRLIVLTEWAYAYLTYQRGVRLITGVEREHRAGMTA